MITIDGTEYELSTKLRVAYKVQGQNAHRPYAEIFSQIDSMTLEKQIDILYAAFEIANPEVAKNQISRTKFLDWYLDNCNVGVIMEQLQEVIGGILGQDLKKKVDEESQKSEDSAEGN